MKTAIIYFCFNRPDSTEKTLRTITSCLKSNHHLFIFQDGPRNVGELDKIEEVRKIIFKSTNDLSNVGFEPKPLNFGLKNSVIAGISQVFSAGFERAIILEDDISICKNFFKYCENALEKFENRKEVFSITGWGFPQKFDNEKSKIFLEPKFSSWGWATWRDRWEKVNFSAENPQIQVALKNKKSLKKIGNNFHEFLKFVQNGKIDSWATFCALHCHLNNLINVYPTKPLVKNIGFEGGTHFKKADDISKIYKKYDVNFNEDLPLLEINQKFKKVFDKIDKKKGKIKSKNINKIIYFCLGLIFGLILNNLI